MKNVGGILCLAILLTGAGDSGGICQSATGDRDGLFHTLWYDGGEGCLTLTRNDGYEVRWKLEPQGNLVAGRGWRRGGSDRMIGYHAKRFEPGVNGYLAVYGWSQHPLVEYYVVERWGNFIPPGPGAESLGLVQSDGGTYRLYRTRRIDQPSIAGTASFNQYWSVRTVKRPLGQNNVVTLRNHINAWSKAGLRLGSLDYQVVATEGFGSTGTSSVTVWDARGSRRR